MKYWYVQGAVTTLFAPSYERCTQRPHFTRQYIPEDNSEHHTRRRENLKSHNALLIFHVIYIRLVGQRHRQGTDQLHQVSNQGSVIYFLLNY
jgi:hypothetical protein